MEIRATSWVLAQIQKLAISAVTTGLLPTWLKRGRARCYRRRLPAALALPLSSGSHWSLGKLGNLLTRPAATATSPGDLPFWVNLVPRIKGPEAMMVLAVVSSPAQLTRPS